MPTFVLIKIIMYLVIQVRKYILHTHTNTHTHTHTHTHTYKHTHTYAHKHTTDVLWGCYLNEILNLEIWSLRVWYLLILKWEICTRIYTYTCKHERACMRVRACGNRTFSTTHVPAVFCVHTIYRQCILSIMSCNFGWSIDRIFKTHTCFYSILNMNDILHKYKVIYNCI